MQKGLAQMKHVLDLGTNKTVIVLLHGTGGDARSLMGLAKQLSPESTLLGIEGDVLENGMRRYFARYSDGSFDLESLHEATIKLQETIQSLLEEHNLTDHKVALLGYSNGANIAVNIFKEYETRYDLALLLHPSSGRATVPFKAQTKLTAFITSGDNDPFISKEEFDVLEDTFRQADIKVEVFRHQQGHQLTQAELYKTAELLAKLEV